MDLFHDICFEFRDPRVPAEQIGWAYAIRGYDLGSLKGKPKSVAVVVDHALGDLDVFNRRQKRIGGMIYLPEEFMLVYASAERGQSQFANKAMGVADWASARMLDLIADNLSDNRCLEPAPDGEPFALRRSFIGEGEVQDYDIAEAKQKLKYELR